MKNFLTLLAIAPLALTSCDQKSVSQAATTSGTSITPAAATGNASPSFHGELTNVVSNLETNGSHFSVTHIDDDFKQFAKTADGILAIVRKNSNEVPPNLSVVKLLNDLGLGKIDAMGQSSRSTQNAWHNRQFIQTNGDRSGLLSIMGDEGSEWRAAGMAPADADMVVEFELNFRQITETIKVVSSSFGAEAEKGFAEVMREKIADGAMTVGDLLGKTNLRTTLIVSMDRSQRWNVSEEVELPTMNVALRIERGMWLWKQFGEPIEADAEVSERDGLKIIKAPEEMNTPMGKLRPVIVIDQAKDLIWVSLTEEYLAKCQSPEKKLAGSDDFKQATAGFPDKGNGLFYVSGNFCNEIIQQVKNVRKNLPVDPKEAAGFDEALGLLGVTADNAAFNRGYACCVANTKTGILCVGNSPFPDKGYGMMNGVIPIAAMSGFTAPLVIRQRQKADQVMAMNNMRQMFLALMEYDADHGKYPTQLIELVEKNILAEDNFNLINHCKLNGDSQPFVYIPGHSSSENPETIIMYSPTTADGKRIYLRNDGSVKSTSVLEFQELLEKQKTAE